MDSPTHKWSEDEVTTKKDALQKILLIISKPKKSSLTVEGWKISSFFFAIALLHLHNALLSHELITY